MGNFNSISVKSSTSRHSRRTGNASSLASFSVQEAGSGLYGKSSKHLTRFRIATWNVGTLKRRSNEVIETLSRRLVDVCGVQEHKWSGSWLPNQTCFLTGKNSKFKFYWCGSKDGHGGIKNETMGNKSSNPTQRSPNSFDSTQPITTRPITTQPAMTSCTSTHPTLTSSATLQPSMTSPATITPLTKSSNLPPTITSNGTTSLDSTQHNSKSFNSIKLTMALSNSTQITTASSNYMQLATLSSNFTQGTTGPSNFTQHNTASLNFTQLNTASWNSTQLTTTSSNYTQASTASSKSKEITQLRTDYFYKLNLGAEHANELLSIIFHNKDHHPNYVGAPEDGRKLYQLMVLFKQHKEKKFQKHQWELLCPSNGQQTSDSKEWDVTLISAVIKNWPSNISPLSNYLQIPKHLLDVVNDIRSCRNNVKHSSLYNLQDKTKFNAIWSNIRSVLVQGTYKNIAEFDAIESRDLQFFTDKVVKFLDDAQKSLAMDVRILETEMVEGMSEVKKEIDSVRISMDNLSLALTQLRTDFAKVSEETGLKIWSNFLNLQGQFKDLSSQASQLEKDVCKLKEDQKAEKQRINVVEEKQMKEKERVDKLEEDLKKREKKQSNDKEYRCYVIKLTELKKSGNGTDYFYAQVHDGVGMKDVVSFNISLRDVMKDAKENYQPIIISKYRLEESQMKLQEATVIEICNQSLQDLSKEEAKVMINKANCISTLAEIVTMSNGTYVNVRGYVDAKNTKIVKIKNGSKKKELKFYDDEHDAFMTLTLWNTCLDKVIQSGIYELRNLKISEFKGRYLSSLPLTDIILLQPVMPTQLVTPIQSNAPIQSDTPIKPVAPTQSFTPIQSDTPIKPIAPTESVTPIQSDTPIRPDTSMQLVVPKQSVAPIHLVTPIQPATSIRKVTPIHNKAAPIQPDTPPIQPDTQKEPDTLILPVLMMKLFCWK